MAESNLYLTNRMTTGVLHVSRILLGTRSLVLMDVHTGDGVSIVLQHHTTKTIEKKISYAPVVSRNHVVLTYHSIRYHHNEHNLSTRR